MATLAIEVAFAILSPSHHHLLNLLSLRGEAAEFLSPPQQAQRTRATHLELSGGGRQDF